MESSSQKLKQDCSSMLLQEYLDGELAAEAEFALERHLAACAVCLEELNRQKSILGILNQNVEPEIPNNFAEIVFTRADSQVAGLRRRIERNYTISVAAFLALIAFVLLAFDISRPMSSLEAIFGKLASFVMLVAGILANIALGLYVVAKVISQHIDRQGAILVFAITIIVAGVFLWAVRSGKLSHLRAVKR